MENLSISEGTKAEKYRNLLPQIKALIAGEFDLTANMANICAALKQTFDFFWVGFYVVKGDSLVLSPFQGTVACTRIAFGKGVCGSSWVKRQTIIVPDVNLFPGHIACNADSKSEIVVPLILDDKVIGVLDIDSDTFNCFNQIDAEFLEAIVNELCLNIKQK